MNMKRIVNVSLLLFMGALLLGVMSATLPPDPEPCDCPDPVTGECPTECPTDPPCDCPDSNGDCPDQCPLPLEGRMTGGGSFFDGDDESNTRFTHGFTLRCSGGPNNLEINWNGKGNKGSDRFHLESLTSITCIDDPDLDEEHPVAGFDTVIGSGIGRLNGVSGATIEFTFTDDGEPGKFVDNATISITPAGGGTPITSSGSLMKGNQQAHP